VAKAISPATQEVAKTAPEAVKVSREIVKLVNELSEVRAIANSANARVEVLRKAILTKVGKADLTLIHNNIEVARIIESNPVRLNEEFLQANFPEAYEASLKPRQQFTIRSVTRKAK
jgi:transcriptional regulator